MVPTRHTCKHDSRRPCSIHIFVHFCDEIYMGAVKGFFPFRCSWFFSRFWSILFIFGLPLLICLFFSFFSCIWYFISQDLVSHFRVWWSHCRFVCVVVLLSSLFWYVYQPFCLSILIYFFLSFFGFSWCCFNSFHFFMFSFDCRISQQVPRWFVWEKALG